MSCHFLWRYLESTGVQLKSLLQNRIARRILLLKTQTRMMWFENQCGILEVCKIQAELVSEPGHVSCGKGIFQRCPG